MNTIKILIFLFLSFPCFYASNPNKAPLQLDCQDFPCSEVLPGAHHFRPVEHAAYWEALDADDQVIGWVVLSTDVVKIKAYSGQPLETLVGLDQNGIITGAKIMRHSEPILLVGIPEQKLYDFVAFYRGLKATQEVVVGSASQEGALEIDVISGATVTALAQNRTILDTARALGSAVGIIETPPGVPGHFVDTGEVLTWDHMRRKGLFGHLNVEATDMNPTDKGTKEPFSELWFTLIDAPDVGQSILGEGDYQWLKNRMQPGEHLLLIFGNGSYSFKGSGFVRGGIFDRIRIEQGLHTTFFRDTDYFNLSGNRAQGGPQFKEGAVFFVREGKLDPGRSFDLVFLGSYYDGLGGFSRSFKEFRASHRMPRSVYALDGPDPDTLIWRRAWTVKHWQSLVLIAFLAIPLFLFGQRSWMTGRMTRLKITHKIYLLTSFILAGIYLKAQPSITQVLTFLDGIVHNFDLNLFLSEPYLFIAWIFIAITTILWGRGVFCGWVCPFGAMTELLFALGQKLGIRSRELPDRLHAVLRYARYLVFLGLVPAYLYSPELGERLAEIEPFKTTFFVIPWTRNYLFFGWWLFWVLVSIVTYRPFCRYLCPLGAALALPSSFRVSGPFRRQACSTCKICTKTCEPRAIGPDGRIDSRECLNCMECEANYEEKDVCPPLIGLERLEAKPQSEWSEHDRKRHEKFLHGKMKV